MLRRLLDRLADVLVPSEALHLGEAPWEEVGHVVAKDPRYDGIMVTGDTGTRADMRPRIHLNTTPRLRDARDDEGR